MPPLRRTLALAATGVLIVGLSACNSGSDAAPAHDHSAHDGAAGMAPMDDGHDHGAADMVMPTTAAATAATVSLKKIEPSANYPLDTCVVSGEALGEMGDVIAYEYDGQEIQFCCAGCVDEFKESPADFVAKVRAAAAR